MTDSVLLRVFIYIPAFNVLSMCMGLLFSDYDLTKNNNIFLNSHPSIENVLMKLEQTVDGSSEESGVSVRSCYRDIFPVS